MDPGASRRKQKHPEHHAGEKRPRTTSTNTIMQIDPKSLHCVKDALVDLVKVVADNNIPKCVLCNNAINKPLDVGKNACYFVKCGCFAHKTCLIERSIANGQLLWCPKASTDPDTHEPSLEEQTDAKKYIATSIYDTTKALITGYDEAMGSVQASIDEITEILNNGQLFVSPQGAEGTSGAP
jgi:hypothetical protein